MLSAVVLEIQNGSIETKTEVSPVAKSGIHVLKQVLLNGGLKTCWLMTI